jgi:hypothetical protein
MSQWAQQIREAKGPTLDLSNKGITATDCVEIAPALEVISHVLRYLSCAHTDCLDFLAKLIFCSIVLSRVSQNGLVAWWFCCHLLVIAPVPIFAIFGLHPKSRRVACYHPLLVSQPCSTFAVLPVIAPITVKMAKNRPNSTFSNRAR